MPSQQETPNRLDRRSVLPPVRGGLVSLQARRALGTEQDTFGTAGAAMPDRPSRLPPLGGGTLYGPTHMPDKPLHLAAIERPDPGKGKEPIGGKPLPKKGAPQSSQEGGAEGGSTDPKPTLSAPLRPLPGIVQKQPLLGIGSPPARPLPSVVSQPRPLPEIGSPPKPLPAISRRTTLPGLTSPTSSMPPRRITPDPFTTGLNSTAGVTSPAQMTPAPLQFPPSRLSVSKPPGKVTTVGPLSPGSPPATKPPETSPTVISGATTQPPTSTTSPSNGASGGDDGGEQN